MTIEIFMLYICMLFRKVFCTCSRWGIVIWGLSSICYGSVLSLTLCHWLPFSTSPPEALRLFFLFVLAGLSWGKLIWVLFMKDYLAWWLSGLSLLISLNSHSIFSVLAAFWGWGRRKMEEAAAGSNWDLHFPFTHCKSTTCLTADTELLANTHNRPLSPTYFCHDYHSALPSRHKQTVLHTTVYKHLC